MSKVEIKYKGHSVSCYGEMYPEQNIQVCCEDEQWDGIYPDGFDNWTEAVKHIVDNLYTRFPNPVQMEAI